MFHVCLTMEVWTGEVLSGCSQDREGGGTGNPDQGGVEGGHDSPIPEPLDRLISVQLCFYKT